MSISDMLARPIEVGASCSRKVTPLIKSLVDKMHVITGIEVVEYKKTDERENENVPNAIPPKEKNESEPTHFVPCPLPVKYKLVIHEANSFSDVKLYADKIKLGEPLIINYNFITADEARKIFFFLQGCIYALNGCVKKIAPNIYLYAPKSIDVQGGQNKTPIASSDTLHFVWKDYNMPQKYAGIQKKD